MGRPQDVKEQHQSEDRTTALPSEHGKSMAFHKDAHAGAYQVA